MTTYHVWLTGQDQPETVVADDIREIEGALFFWDAQVNAHRRFRRFDNWRRWSIVHDEADHI